jgi:methyl-accepting chemotaxis protein
MPRMSNIKIAGRIAIATILPLLAFAAFAGMGLLEKWSNSQSAGRVATLIETVPSVSNLVHQLQRERGASATFVGSKGQALGDVMRSQRVATDKAIAEWHERMGVVDVSALGASFGRILEQVKPAIADISNVRRDVDALSIAGPKVVSYFSSTIASLIGLLEASGEISDDLRINQKARSFVAMVKRKELVGQERAVGAGAFAAGEFAPDVYRNFVRLQALQEAQVSEFEKGATKSEIEAVAGVLKGAAVEELARMRAIASAAPFEKAAVKSVAAPVWFNTITQYIDLLKTAEDRIAADFLNVTHAFAGEAKSGFYGIAAVSIAVLLLVVGMTILVARSITRPIARLLPTMSELAKGNHGVEVADTERGDEIGEMAKAVLVFREAGKENTRLQAQAAEQERRSIREKAEQDRIAAEKAQADAKEKSERELKAASEKAERDRLATEERIAQDKKMAAERAAAEAKVMADLDAAVGGIVKAAMAGDFSQRVPLDGKEGTIRNLASAMNTLCETMGKVMGELVSMLSALADGDLTQRIDGSYLGTFATLKDRANSTAETLSSTVSGITAAVKEVTNAAAEISTSTTDLSQRTEEQAASLEETSASMEEMSGTVKSNAENAQHANQLAASARQVADRGTAVVTDTVEAMGRIEQSSTKITDIIGVIDEIARQINLLALNAAVEAARAGEAGRGFAVVASEVRSLAQRSSQAAKDISDLISNSSAQVKEGADLVHRTGESLKEIVQSIRKVADIVGDIATASAEQSTGIDQINKALTQMDEVTQQNSALVEENAATAKTLEEQAEAMTRQVAFFRVDRGAQGSVSKRTGRAAA